MTGIPFPHSWYVIKVDQEHGNGYIGMQYFIPNQVVSVISSNGDYYINADVEYWNVI